MPHGFWNSSRLKQSVDELLPDELKSGETAKGQLQLIPGVHKTDGFFLAKFRKTEKGRA